MLDLPIDQVMMTAAHKDDLQAAHNQGMKTAYVPRPKEHGPDRVIDTSPEPWMDVCATSFEELASKLGV
jgi:2-haloacid dehalogenase